MYCKNTPPPTSLPWAPHLMASIPVFQHNLGMPVPAMETIPDFNAARDEWNFKTCTAPVRSPSPAEYIQFLQTRCRFCFQTMCQALKVKHSKIQQSHKWKVTFVHCKSIIDLHCLLNLIKSMPAIGRIFLGSYKRNIFIFCFLAKIIRCNMGGI